MLSPEEVLHLPTCAQSVKQRAILTTCYAAGPRISEAIHLKPADDRKTLATGAAVFNRPPVA